jgi:hypothetical protein
LGSNPNTEDLEESWNDLKQIFLAAEAVCGKEEKKQTPWRRDKLNEEVKKKKKRSQKHQNQPKTTQITRIKGLRLKLVSFYPNRNRERNLGPS